MDVPFIIRKSVSRWFSDAEGGADIILEFDVPEDKWRNSFKLNDDEHISELVRSIEWFIEGNFRIELYVITGDNDYDIPYVTINSIIMYLNGKFKAELRVLSINFFNGDIDLNSIVKIPKNLNIMSCVVNNMIIPSYNRIENLSIYGTTDDRSISTINIDIEKCTNLRELSITGDYKFHHSIYGTNKFRKLTKLSKLYMVEEGEYHKHHQLPHLEYCNNLKTVVLSSKYIPKSIRNNGGFKIVSLCKNLRKSLHTRLIDICIALCNYRINSKRLPSYVIMNIVDWLPYSDWYSPIQNMYDNHSLPKWKLRETEKIKIIQNINERKRPNSVLDTV
jgi:hypothetical protein